MTSTQSEVWRGEYTRHAIQKLAVSGIEISLGNVYSGSYNPDEERKQLEDDADGLLQLFGIETDGWQHRIVAAHGTFTNEIGAIGNTKYRTQELERMAAGSSLGKFMMNQAFDAVPFEGSDEEIGNFSLSLQLEPNLIVTFISDGEQEVYREYIDPSTGERLTGEEDELEAKAASGEATTDIAEVHTNISYSAVFANCQD